MPRTRQSSAAKEPEATPAEYGHFAIVPARAVFDTRLHTRTLQALLLISTHTNTKKGGWCCPSLYRLSDLMGISRWAVRKHLVLLAQLGYLEVEPRTRSDGGDTSYAYRVLYDPILPDEFDTSVKRAAPAAPVDTPQSPPEVTGPVTSRGYPNGKYERRYTKGRG